jgi:hypothetical protein
MGCFKICFFVGVIYDFSQYLPLYYRTVEDAAGIIREMSFSMTFMRKPFWAFSTIIISNCVVYLCCI